MVEKPPSGVPRFKNGEYPPLCFVEGSSVSGVEQAERLARLMDELPRLKLDYMAHTHGRDTLELEEFRQICNQLSLRAEPFIEWDQDYFDEQFTEIVRIARERGSHE